VGGAGGGVSGGGDSAATAFSGVNEIQRNRKPGSREDFLFLKSDDARRSKQKSPLLPFRLPVKL
jgi:hypothetical protein